MRCACLADTHDSTSTLCTPPKPCEQCCVRRPRVICGAVHRTPHPLHYTRLTSTNATPNTRDITSRRGNTHYAATDLRHSAPVAGHPMPGHPCTRLGTYCDNLPGNRTPVMPVSACCCCYQLLPTHSLCFKSDPAISRGRPSQKIHPRSVAVRSQACLPVAHVPGRPRQLGPGLRVLINRGLSVPGL